MKNNAFDWNKTNQFSIIQFLFAIFIPSGIAFAGFHWILPALVANGVPVMVAWPSVAAVMLLGFVVIAVFLLQKDARSLGITFWARACFRRLSAKEWAIYLGIAVLGIFAAMAAQGLILPMLDAVHFTVPSYMPFFLNPAVNPASADMSVLSPGLPLKGSFGLLPLIGIALILNILTEELYFRAWLLPKLSRFGPWAWVLNGVFFALYHTFQLWLLPTLLAASLVMAFIFYKSRSVWPPLVAHFVANFLLSILAIIALVVG